MRGSDSAVCAKAEYSTDGGATYNYTAAGEILEAAGSYKLRYTAVEGSSLPGNTAEYSFVIMDEYFDNASAVSVTGATVTAGADKSGSVTHKGLLIAPAEEKGIYSGKINGIFAQGSTTIQFSSPGTSNQATASAIYFKFVDTNDSSNYFTVEYSQNGWYTARRWETTKVIIVPRDTIIPKIFSKKKRNTAGIRRITVSFIRGWGKRFADRQTFPRLGRQRRAYRFDDRS
ncbi:MAG: hypothetical protein ACLUSP_04775 [Christensenellales bacterium]